MRKGNKIGASCDSGVVIVGALGERQGKQLIVHLWKLIHNN